MGVKCFMIEETDQVRRYLRRYHMNNCPAEYRFYNGMTDLDTVKWPANTVLPSYYADAFLDRPDWPTKCDCGHEYTLKDAHQIFQERVWKRADTGEEFILRDAPVGAMWDAWWYRSDNLKGPDGKCLVVKCPGGRDWIIDSRANNCTMPDDDVHKCWCRHGEAPNITVDKNGNTCAAGGGSILTSNWHGFLRDGELVE